MDRTSRRPIMRRDYGDMRSRSRRDYARGETRMIRDYGEDYRLDDRRDYRRDYDYDDMIYRPYTPDYGEDYYTVAHKLELIAELFGCDKLVMCCYNHLLTSVYGFPQRFANNMTVAELGKALKNKKLLVRTDGHLTFVDNGVLYDTFDCRRYKADVYWIVK